MENNTVLVKPKTTPNRMLDEITNSMHLRAPPEKGMLHEMKRNPRMLHLRNTLPKVVITPNLKQEGAPQEKVLQILRVSFPKNIPIIQKKSYNRFLSYLII